MIPKDHGLNVHLSRFATQQVLWTADHIAVAQSVSEANFQSLRFIDRNIFCLGSTIGAAWRPVAPSYPYYPPMPDNWPQAVKANANWGAQTSQYSGYIGQFGALLELLQHVRIIFFHNF